MTLGPGGVPRGSPQGLPWVVFDQVDNERAGGLHEVAVGADTARNQVSQALCLRIVARLAQGKKEPPIRERRHLGAPHAVLEQRRSGLSGQWKVAHGQVGGRLPIHVAGHAIAE